MRAAYGSSTWTVDSVRRERVNDRLFVQTEIGEKNTKMFNYKTSALWARKVEIKLLNEIKRDPPKSLPIGRGGDTNRTWRRRV